MCRSVELLYIEDRQHPLDVGPIPQPVRDHPLLWPYTDCGCDLYVASPPPDLRATIGHLAAAHDALVGTWCPFSSWFAQKNIQAQTDLLRTGTGCFAVFTSAVLVGMYVSMLGHGVQGERSWGYSILALLTVSCACIGSLFLATLALLLCERPRWPGLTGLILSFGPAALGIYIICTGG